MPSNNDCMSYSTYVLAAFKIWKTLKALRIGDFTVGMSQYTNQF